MSFGALPSGDFFLGHAAGRSQGEADGLEEGLQSARKWRDYAKSLESEVGQLRVEMATVVAIAALRGKALEEQGHPLGAVLSRKNNKFVDYWAGLEADQLKKHGLNCKPISDSIKRPDKASDWY